MLDASTALLRNSRLTALTPTRGARVRTWDDHYGTVQYVKGDWVGVRCDGERGVYEWQVGQLEVVS